MAYLKSLAMGLAAVIAMLILIIVYNLARLTTDSSTGIGAVAGGISDLGGVALLLAFLAGFLWEYRRATRKAASAR
jgi:hypothetical protein